MSLCRLPAAELNGSNVEQEIGCGSQLSWQLAASWLPNVRDDALEIGFVAQVDPRPAGIIAAPHSPRRDRASWQHHSGALLMIKRIPTANIELWRALKM
jgi:hypothetical protein